MAHDPRRLRRYNSVTMDGNVQIHWYNYATNASLAEILAPGYFNASRDYLTKDSIIDVVCDVGGFPARVVLRLTAVALPAPNVTVATDPGN